MKFEVGDLVTFKYLEYPTNESDEANPEMELPLETWDWMVYNHLEDKLGIIYEETSKAFKVWFREPDNESISVYKEAGNLHEESDAEEVAACYHNMTRLKKIS